MDTTSLDSLIYGGYGLQGFVQEWVGWEISKVIWGGGPQKEDGDSQKQKLRPELQD